MIGRNARWARVLLLTGLSCLGAGAFGTAAASAGTQGFYVYNFTKATLMLSTLQVEGPQPVFEQPGGNSKAPPIPRAGEVLRPGERMHVELISEYSYFGNSNRRLVNIHFTQFPPPEKPSGRNYSVYMETGDANFVFSYPSQTDMSCVFDRPHRCPVVGTTAELLDPLATQTRMPGTPPVKGDVFVADTDHNRVLEVNPDGSELLAGAGLNHPRGVALNPKGDLFIADTDHNRVVEVPASGGAQKVVASGLDHPMGVATDARGDLFIADTRNYRVLRRPAGGGPLTQVGPRLFQPLGMDIDSRGNLFVVTGPEVVEIPANGAPERVVVKNLDYPVGVVVNADRDAFISIRGTGQIVEVPGNGGRMRTVVSDLNRPNGLALYANHLFVADTNQNRVMKAPVGGGVLRGVVHGLNRPFGVAVFGG